MTDFRSLNNSCVSHGSSSIAVPIAGGSGSTVHMKAPLSINSSLDTRFKSSGYKGFTGRTGLSISSNRDSLSPTKADEALTFLRHESHSASKKQ